MLYLIAAATVWVGILGVAAAKIAARIPRGPRADIRGLGDWLSYAFCILLVFWLLYNMGVSLVDGRIKFPFRGPDRYFLMARSPAIFWSIFLFEYLLTLALGVPTLIGVGVVIARRIGRGGKV